MVELKRKYENVIIINTKIGEESIKLVIEKFQKLISNNANLLDVQSWGKRKLAYPINFEHEGFYVLFNFESDPKFPLELNRQYRIDDSIMRFIIINKVENKKVNKKNVQTSRERV